MNETTEPDYSDFAPLSDAEIEQLSHQEPVNQGLQLPANEKTYEQIETN